MSTWCASCTPSADWPGEWDETACVDGNVYGPCQWPTCGGLCEYVTVCGCACHTLPPPS